MARRNPDDDAEFIFGRVPPEQMGIHNENLDVEEDEVRSVVDRALQDTPSLCPHCKNFCPDHVVRIRDAFLERAGELAIRLSKGILLYKGVREHGISEPQELIQSIYDDWGELFILYTQSEPQEVLERLAEQEEGEEEQS